MANVPTNNWDETKPAGTRDINLGDDDIREFKTQVREIIAADHKIESANSGEDWGHHNIVTLLVQAAMATVANAGRICSKSVSGIIELFYRDDAGTETQITSNGVVNVVVPSATIVGEIRGYSGATAPTGWLLCNGAAIDRTTYADLFAVTGILYGAGDGATTFNIPDLRGRVAVGKSTDTEFDALGETGGEKTHLLTTDEMPAHTHTQTTSSFNINADNSGSRAGNATTTNTGSTGGGAAHNNLQPYQVINYIIKT